MLPYRLRPPAFGNKFPQRNSDAGSNPTSFREFLSKGGGPVQHAIEQDLLELRPSFRHYLQNSRQPRTTTEPSSITTVVSMEHCKPGVAFGAFKEMMKSSKLSFLHSLAPSRCDREAFSQLIYASCLSLLKTAFSQQQFATSKQPTEDQQESVLFNDAAYALFALYALFQTNPLPRTAKTQFELLPLKLHSQENPRSRYRRFFAPNIHIDQYHYSLLLRLRDLALVEKDNCHCLFIKAYERCIIAKLNAHASSDEPNNDTWTCTCGMAQDTIELVDRLLPVLDLGEYTGPLSLEGLAGHAALR